MTSAIIRLPDSLSEGSSERAVRVLQRYFAPVDEDSGFTGGAFDFFDPSGTRSVSRDFFTADDLVSVTLLSVDVPARVALHLLGDGRPHYQKLLEEIGPDRDLADVESIERDQFPSYRLWHALRELPGLGPTTVSKLMARKRPRLIPIFDSVINERLLGGTGILWAPLHATLRADDRRLHRRLLELRYAAGLGDDVSALRVLDVLTWMDARS